MCDDIDKDSKSHVMTAQSDCVLALKFFSCISMSMA